MTTYTQPNFVHGEATTKINPNFLEITRIECFDYMNGVIIQLENEKKKMHTPSVPATSKFQVYPEGLSYENEEAYQRQSLSHP